MTDGFGPLGAGNPDAYSHTDEYVDSTGKRVRRAEFPGEKIRAKQFKAMYRTTGGTQGRKPKGVPVGGQFTTSARGETGTRLY